MRLLRPLSILALAPSLALAQGTAPSLTVDAIFSRGEFRTRTAPPVTWLAGGDAWITFREVEGGTRLLSVNAATGAETVLAEPRQLVVDGKPLAVEDVQLTGDPNVVLLFHSSVPVWRNNTRGIFHVLDLRSKQLRPVSKGLQMFAKLSPDGKRVGFVKDNDLWVTELATGKETRLTADGSAEIINGTTDWVTEEEFGLADAFRWSPDSKRIAYWRFDQTSVPAFPLVDELGLYPKVSTLRYPKVGQPNAVVKIGTVAVTGGPTTWIEVGGEGEQYVPRMEWVGSDSVFFLRLPRKQNEVHVLMASVSTGKTRTVLTERDSAYFDVEGDPLVWLPEEKQFLWRSDRGAARHWYLYGRDGRLVRQVTNGAADVTGLVGVDAKAGVIYVIAAAPDPTQRQLFRASLDGRRFERVTREAGAWNVNLGPDAKWAVVTHSALGVPPTSTLRAFPAFTAARTLAENGEVAKKLAALDIRAPERFRVAGANGEMLDGYRIVPANFDSTKKHPVLIFQYSGPAAPQVVDSWGGPRYLWHQSLARQGVVVVVVDPRGAAWRGTQFRKQTQGRLGELEAQDHIAVAKWIGQRPWGDASRIGIWGWSYGGYMSSLAAAQGGTVFRMAMAVAPVTDWRLYDTIYTERYMGLPTENEKGYVNGAPQTHVANLEADLLLVHGTGDDNVHPQNVTQLTDKLIQAGKPFEQLMYPNSTHSISRGKAQAHLYGQMTRFVQRTLLGQVAGMAQ